MSTQQQNSLWDWIEGRLPGDPAAQHLGWQCLDIDPEQGTITVQFQPRPEFLNPAGLIQGGFLSAMFDHTMSPALHAMLPPGQFPLALELKVSFLNPARLEPLVCRARVVKRGSTIAFLAGELVDSQGELVATATQTVRIVTLQPGTMSFDGNGAQETKVS